MWWHVLGVEPTDDEKTVKKAYAVLIKDIDQDRQIDEFTKIHQAFRMAMKSFKTEVTNESSMRLYEDSSSSYLLELSKQYQDPNKRLNCVLWKNLFACMSFQEEEKFKAEYITFFNEHYFLTEEIWDIVEQQYPLKEQKSFLWKDLCNGNFRIQSKEIENFTPKQANIYVECKVRFYYAWIKKKFEEAYSIVQEGINVILGTNNMPSTNNMSGTNLLELYRFSLCTAIELSREEEIKRAYDIILSFEAGHNETTNVAWASYYYAGYMLKKGQIKQSLELIQSIPEAVRDTRTKALYSHINSMLTQIYDEGVNLMPWNELQALSKKKIKQLSSGNYQKALKEE